MADTENDKVWVNTLMDKEQAEKLDEMVKDNGSTRAAFVRLLIDREYAERKRVEAQKKVSFAASAKSRNRAELVA